ncbi:hypothetical protein CH063_09476, partial [Colletotrichum higginsianum]
TNTAKQRSDGSSPVATHDPIGTHDTTSILGVPLDQVILVGKTSYPSSPVTGLLQHLALSISMPRSVQLTVSRYQQRHLDTQINMHPSTEPLPYCHTAVILCVLVCYLVPM